ncbi:protein SULFUR DEFICIENCY-INDUCED 1-like isoform X2 [Macadamia integrifolia]|uniref:protein SULFUR DEFICIENCY-INDUCED 1-like isoform X2 n=1 Tax=Macadamia integrifolia TaxID=60698 RepID=UPI001C529C26|nr:protein SULFUR DEFICIENCY-INDUCED 1-like isoform X2 [Macadamia integrifolia]
MEGGVGKTRQRSSRKREKEVFHVIHKVPSGDSPYVRAKYAQLILKNQETAIVLFWKAINEGDRVDSALKDMAVVMKQQDRAEEAIEAIKSFRYRCSKQAQESLDNVLIDLYKKCGRIDEEIELLKQKLRLIYQGEAFNGKHTKTARSHGRRFQVSIKQETSRILGNLGWAYMRQTNYVAAEVVYRKAQLIEPDANKACNLGLCLIKQGRYNEARSVLEDVLKCRITGSNDSKLRNRVDQLVRELESLQSAEFLSTQLGQNLEEIFAQGLDQLLSEWRKPPIFEEISQFRDQVAC